MCVACRATAPCISYKATTSGRQCRLGNTVHYIERRGFKHDVYEIIIIGCEVEGLTYLNCNKLGGKGLISNSKGLFLIPKCNICTSVEVFKGNVEVMAGRSLSLLAQILWVTDS